MTEQKMNITLQPFPPRLLVYRSNKTEINYIDRVLNTLIPHTFIR